MSQTKETTVIIPIPPILFSLKDYRLLVRLELSVFQKYARISHINTSKYCVFIT